MHVPGHSPASVGEVVPTQAGMHNVLWVAADAMIGSTQERWVP